MPEVVWKAYIDFEISQEEPERVRQLYERLLEKTTHVKVIIFFQFKSHSIVHNINYFYKNVIILVIIFRYGLLMHSLKCPTQSSKKALVTSIFHEEFMKGATIP